MARISSYTKDAQLTSADKVIGTDSATGNTANFVLSDMVSFMETNIKLPTYIFEQVQAASSWVITHNLGKFPSVEIIDTGGNLVLGEITYNSINQVTLTFNAAFSGKAYLN